LYAPNHQEHNNLIIVITIIALIFQFITAWKMVEMLSSGKMPAELITPALYVPVVPGGLVGGMALNAIGFSGFGVLLWGMGVGAWALLEMRILSHLFKGPLPEPIRATIGIEMAPAAVSTLTAIALWPTIPVDAILIGLGIASGPILAVLTRWKAWTNIPFSFGFWSFSFPVAATASCIIEAVQRGSWPKEVAVISVSLATLIIGYLALRTLIQLIQGKLLPKAS
jgi:tellurite resistance protein